MIWWKFLLTSMMSNSNHLRFGIAMGLDLISVQARNTLFEPTSGATFHGSGVVKLGSMHPSGSCSLPYFWQMGGDSCLLWQSTNQKSSEKNWNMVSPKTVRSMQPLLVIWTMMSGRRTSAISGQHQGQWNVNVQLFYLISMTPHYDDDSFNVMASNFSHPFILKAGNSESDQTNENGLNAALKAVHNKK